MTAVKPRAPGCERFGERAPNLRRGHRVERPSELAALVAEHLLRLWRREANAWGSERGTAAAAAAAARDASARRAGWCRGARGWCRAAAYRTR
eukprot:6383074-Prymnesium_polylepis.1